jgi:ankyrin repeat protein
VNAKNQTGGTALKTAKRLEHKDIVKLLEEAGAKE